MGKQIKKDKKKGETPLMKQYNEIKTKYPDAMLLFRVGDFYETFNDDARKASKILGIVLTKRSNGSSDDALAGFPHHSLDTYLPKLVRAGQRVAVCDQLEDPKMTKKIVKRGVTELVTPGVAVNDQVLTQKENNYLAALVFSRARMGVAFLDVSTGDFSVAEGPEEYIKKLLANFRPNEVLFPKAKYNDVNELLHTKTYTYGLEDWVFGEDYAKEKLENHFDIKSLKGFGLDKQKLAAVAAGVVLHYLADTHHNSIGHIQSISRIIEDDFVWMDAFTIRNLELLGSAHEDAITLLDVLDETQTPMGGRLLRKWLVMPLKEKKAIDSRLKMVSNLLEDKTTSEVISEALNAYGDVERIISKVAVGKVSPKELIILLNSIKKNDELQKGTKANKVIKELLSQLKDVSTVELKIENELYEDPPAVIGKGRLIADGVSDELDEYRRISTKGKDYLLNLQQTESERTGIPSLKIAFNNVFGYYIEVRNTHKDKIPENWIRKQTLVSAERYITEELKEFEVKILQAEEKIAQLESQIFKTIVDFICDKLTELQYNAKLIGQLDCLNCFAQLARKNNYTKPEISEGLELEITEGRHPVIEKNLPIGQEYISNDLRLDPRDQQIIMITGPNMAGKSALLRQTALITIMAQIGCFVPAKFAKIGLVDRIFTRVGASDNISTGESTFMVEMNETSNILNNISERSLILLDEIGRGTSTYDGVSIAWAITEYLHEYPLFKAKTLFATHYHELNEMTNTFNRIKNFNVTVKELNGKVIFMRKLAEGGSNHSFGIHVAKLAGMPKTILNRANEVLADLERNRKNVEEKKASKTKTKKGAGGGMQLSFIQLDDPVLEQIRNELVEIDVNTLTPVEALMKLNEIKRYLGS